MKPTSSALFDIINRMSDDEKNYFRIYSIQLKQFKHLSTARLLELFNAINSQKEYDETKLMKQIGTALSTKSFKTCKSVLRELILESLYYQHNSGNATDTPQRHLHHAEILIAKDLGQLALADLNHLHHKLESIEQRQNPLLQTQLLSLKNKALLHIPGSPADSKIAQQFALYQQIQLLQHEQEQELITAHLAQMASQGLLLNTQADAAQLTELQKITHCYAQKINNPNHYYVIKQSLYIALLEGNFEKYFDRCHHLFSHYLQLQLKQELNTEDQILFAESFINLIRACLLSRNADILTLAFNAAMQPYMQLFACNQYYHSFFQYALLLMLYQDTAHGEMAAQIEDFEERWCPSTDQHDMLRYRWFYTTLALHYYNKGHYKAALRHCHLVTATNPNNLTEIHCRDFCNLFQFIIQHDMLPPSHKANPDDTLLDSAINKLQREHGLSGEHKNRSFELCILHYLYTPGAANRNLCLAELNLLRHTATAKHFNALFNFEEWISKQY